MCVHVCVDACVGVCVRVCVYVFVCAKCLSGRLPVCMCDLQGAGLHFTQGRHNRGDPTVRVGIRTGPTIDP